MFLSNFLSMRPSPTFQLKRDSIMFCFWLFLGGKKIVMLSLNVKTLETDDSIERRVKPTSTPYQSQIFL